MSSTNFIDQSTPIIASWLNDVNTATYTTVPANTAGIVSNAAALATYEANIAASGGSALIGYTQGGSGASNYTVQDVLRSINLGSSSSHTDGTDTIVGSQRLYVGNNTPSSDDSAWLVCRGLAGSYSLGAHAYRDESTYTSPSGTGFFGYSSFDSIANIGGAVHWNHAHSYQSRLLYTGSNTIDEIAGVTFQLTQNGSGAATNVYGIRMMDALGIGTIGTQVALFVDPLTRGTGNYVIYSGSTSVPSYHGGRFQVGTPPQITASGFTTYGAILSHDATGNLLTNPNFTVVSGVVSLKEATAKIVATTTDLQLEGSTKVIANKPIQFPVYTVATLPAATTPYLKAFVSDANATTFNSIVAGSGANKVPVFSDGTNWRIG